MRAVVEGFGQESRLGNGMTVTIPKEPGSSASVVIMLASMIQAVCRQ